MNKAVYIAFGVVVVLISSWYVFGFNTSYKIDRCLSSGGSWNKTSSICIKDGNQLIKNSGIVGPMGLPLLRIADTGCSWGITTGAGLSIASQTCDFGERKVRVASSETLPGYFIEMNDNDNGWIPVSDAITVFKKKSDEPISVILNKVTTDFVDFPKGATCEFQKVNELSTPLLSRYILSPVGKTLDSYKIESKNKNEVPVPPCGKFGLNADSVSYFEIQDTNPDTILFVNIGQEAPLFDETQIKIL